MDRFVRFAGIAPHPPLLVPEVGGDRIRGVASSRQALEIFSTRLIETNPDTVVVISPHSPLDPRCFTVRSTPELTGDFSEFAAPDVRLFFDNDLELIEALEVTARERKVEFKQHPREYPLDHGVLVPLYYLQHAGWTGPVITIGFTFEDNNKHLEFGRVLASSAESIGRGVAVVASGDLSHRLTVDGPYDYEPTAHLFDRQIVDAISAGDSRAVIEIDQDLRERAGECGYRSIMVAFGSIKEKLRDHEVLSYEGPFGVGYLVAVLVDSNIPDAEA